MSSSTGSPAPGSFKKTAVLIGIGSAFSMLGDSTVYTVLPLHTGAAGITLAGAGVLMGANRFVRLLSNPVSGYIYDLGTKKGFFCASLFIGALSTFMLALLRGFWPLFAARVLWGVAWSGISIGGTGILLEQTDSESRGRWIGYYHLWVITGNSLGAFMGGFFSDIIGYRGAMIINGSISLISAAGVFLLFFSGGTAAVTETAPFPEKTGLLRKLRQIPSGIFTVFSLQVKSVFRKGADKRLAAAAGILGLSRFVFSGFLMALISIITREKISPWIAFVGVSTLTGVVGGSKTLVSMVSAPASGIISDRIKDRWAAAAASLFLGSFGLFLITLKPPLFPFAGILFCAVPGSSIMVLMRTLAGECAGRESQGRSAGLVLTAGDLGSALGPPFAFFLLPVLGIDIMFRTLSLLLMVSAFIIIFFIRKTAGRRS